MFTVGVAAVILGYGLFYGGLSNLTGKKDPTGRAGLFQRPTPPPATPGATPAGGAGGTSSGFTTAPPPSVRVGP